MFVSYIISRCLWLSPRIALRCSQDNLFRRERRAIRECRSDKHSSPVRLPLPFPGVPQRSSPWERTRAVAHTLTKEGLVVPGWSKERPIELRPQWLHASFSLLSIHGFPPSYALRTFHYPSRL